MSELDYLEKIYKNFRSSQAARIVEKLKILSCPYCNQNGLITYKNIEYGVMQYIKKMSEQYYDRGLNTVETIGYVFCPKNVNGVKTVSSHWVNLVNKALAVYNYDIRYVSVAQINDLGNNEI